jgi:signal transduction histidine kinase/ActR/RegA family two-component response regulator
MYTRDFYIKIQSFLDHDTSRIELERFFNEIPSMILIIQLKSQKVVFKNHAFIHHDVLKKHEDAIVFKCLKSIPDDMIHEDQYFVIHDLEHDFAFIYSSYPIIYQKNDCVLIRINDASFLYQKLKRDMKILENEHHLLLNKEIELKNASNEHLDLLSSLSHEIRTPMHSIIGYAKLLESTNLNDDQKDYILKILSASNHLSHLVNHIMDFAKLESGKMTIEKKPFKMSQLFLDIKSMTFDIIKQKNIYFDIDDHLCLNIYIGDVNKIKQILINLVTNAIKFTDYGGVTLSCHVIEKTSDYHMKLAIAVTDTGIGLTKDQLDVIFQPYMQASLSTNRRYGGTGLGLPICQKLAHLLKGEIHVKSIPNQGSTFTLEIPLDMDIDEYSKKFLEDESDLKKPKQGAHILVAEDNLLGLKLIERLLINMGMKVTLAKDGNEVLNHLENATFDLIIMDIQMPKLGGIETTKKIRETNQDIPIIALTANTFLEDRVIALDAGMNDYIIKPLDNKSLYQALSHWIPEK